MKKSRGSALTGVILMILVMTLIGVPLLGMVVYNYRLRELDNSIKRAEYENEMAMDRVAIIIRNKVFDSIDKAKNGATTWVDEVSKSQRTNYVDLKEKVKEGETIEPLLDGLAVGKEDYGITDSIVLLDEKGLIDATALNEAYNTVFDYLYRKELTKDAESTNVNEMKTLIQAKDKYSDIVNESDVLAGEEAVGERKTFLRIKSGNAVEDAEKVKVSVETAFKKDATTPQTTLSATFVIGAPKFDEVSSVTTNTVPMSNPLITQGGVVLGKKLTIDEGATLITASDISVLDKGDTAVAIELKKDAKLLSEYEDETVSDSRIASATDIVLNSGAKLSSGTKPIYYRNLYIGKNVTDSEIKVTFNGDVVAKDDLEVNCNGKFTVSQEEEGAKYYGYNDINDDGPDSSSAIVINSTEFDMVGEKSFSKGSITLGDVYLAGRAFIDGVKGTDPTKKDAGRIYKTGESMAIKGNYVAYQTPLNHAVYGADKVTFSTYFMTLIDGSKRPINLVDSFASEPNFGTFDSDSKWEYFEAYATLFANQVKRIKVTANEIRYLEGTGFDKDGNVIGHSAAENTAFKENNAVAFETYTKYIGYRPVEDGEVTSNAKTEIFGTNGWIANPTAGTSADNVEEGTVPEEINIYKTGDKSITLAGGKHSGVIICTGDVTINLTDDTIFAGLIVAGGELTISGNEKTLILENSKEAVVGSFIDNYIEGGENFYNKVFAGLKNDDSGGSYIVTQVEDNIVNMNELIHITNWKKANFGRL